jgi:hypothetical protein
VARSPNLLLLVSDQHAASAGSIGTQATSRRAAAGRRRDGWPGRACGRGWGATPIPRQNASMLTTVTTTASSST